MCDDCRKLKAQLDLAIEFLRTELERKYFRAEFMCHDDEEKKNVSLENARKLKNFLVANGYTR